MCINKTSADNHLLIDGFVVLGTRCSPLPLNHRYKEEGDPKVNLRPLIKVEELLPEEIPEKVPSGSSSGQACPLEPLVPPPPPPHPPPNPPLKGGPSKGGSFGNRFFLFLLVPSGP